MTIQESLKSKLQRNKHIEYCYGLVEKTGVIVEGDWIIKISKDTNNEWERIEYNTETKEIKIRKRGEDGVESYVVLNESLSYGVMDLNDEGMRWEGSCFDNTPFGYGRIYNNTNRLIYEGVMIGYKKECFGVELYPDLGIVEYDGCYWNNKRHGFCQLFDRKGGVLYEGDMFLGNYDTKKTAIVNDSNYDSECINTIIEELIIDSNQLRSIKTAMTLNGWSHLKRIEIKSGSCPKFLSLTLKSIVIRQ